MSNILTYGEDCACQTPAQTPPGSFIQDLYKQMALYGFADIQYVNHSAVGTVLNDDYPQRWRVGVWTGTARKIMALKQCLTDEEALTWESPFGWDIADALAAAIEKLSTRRKESLEK